MTADAERGMFAARLWRHPSAVLLVVQLLGVLLYPFMDTSPVGRAALSLFSLVVLVLAVRAVRATPALSDISPIQPHARAIVMVEQVAGLLYVALVISRIVGLTISRQHSRL